MLFIGDDWAEDHHDVEVQDEHGRAIRAARLPEGVDGMTRFHELVARFLPDDAEPSDVLVCIETDRGPWVRALVTAGYQVYGVNPKQAARHREGMSLSGAKSDKADAHTLADMVRTRRHQLRQVAADSDIAEAVKVVARAHQTLIWERTRHTLRLRAALRDYFPAALAAYQVLTLTGVDALELLAKAPTPAAAAKLTVTQISAVLKKARRRDIPAKATAIQQALRTEHLGQADVVAGAYAATVRATIAVLQTLNTEIRTLDGQVEAHFGALLTFSWVISGRCDSARRCPAYGSGCSGRNRAYRETACVIAGYGIGCWGCRGWPLKRSVSRTATTATCWSWR